MNKKDIKAAVSIEFGLSIERSGKVVDNIFENILDWLRNDKIVELQKFGKFKLLADKDYEKNKSVRFSPSKKLSLRVNSNFENLKKVRLKTGKDSKLYIKKIAPAPGIESEALKKEANHVEAETNKILVNEKPAEKNIQPEQRKLISDDLVNLHKEITREEAKEASKNNLWG